MKGKSILLVTNGQIEWGPSRLRVFQFEESWKSAGFDVNTVSCPNDNTYKDFFQTIPEKDIDIIIIHRYLNKKILKLIKNKKLPFIYDYDDALFYVRSSQISETNKLKKLKYFSKEIYRYLFRGHKYYSSQKNILNRFLNGAEAVFAGNRFLYQYSAPHNKNTQIIPTVVDTDQFIPKKNHVKEPITIGWIGIKDNFLHLNHIKNALTGLLDKYEEKVLIKIVSSEPYFINGYNIVNKQWALADESADLNTFDIGLMPLINDVFAEGKCAFKAIFCMAHAIPCVVSGVGANLDLIKHGQNGFIANSTEEWIEYCSLLIDNVELRRELGEAARKTIEQLYSINSVFPRMLSAVNKIIQTK